MVGWILLRTLVQLEHLAVLIKVQLVWHQLKLDSFKGAGLVDAGLALLYRGR